MESSEAGTSTQPNPSIRSSRRLTSEEIRRLLEESGSDEELSSVVHDGNFAPNVYIQDSDVEQDIVIEQEEEYDSDVSQDSVPEVLFDMTAKDGTEWHSTPLPHSQTRNRNILRQRGGPKATSNLFTPKEVFKSIMSTEICENILRETNAKLRKVHDSNNELLPSHTPNTPSQNTFEPFTEIELDAFFGILIVSGVHRNNRETLSEMWSSDSLPLIRASMSRDRFKLMLECIRFDDENTRTVRMQEDKAAPIRNVWTILNRNLDAAYIPHEYITIDEQLFPYRGRTKFTQYIPSKPNKYGIKVFWACDATTSYPLQGILYTGRPIGGPRQDNIGQRVVLDLVSKYKGSGRNVTTDNFFTSLDLAKALNSWNMSLVGTVRKNKRFLPINMQPNKERRINSTNFAYNQIATVCSYVPKKNKSVVLLSSMHFTGEIEDSIAAKPEIIKFYNKTKSGVDIMDKMLGEYTVKRRTLRWPLAFFFNMIDISGLASYIIYKEHNPYFRRNDQRRIFLKNLATELCRPAIDCRSKNKILLGRHNIRSAIEMVLDRRIIDVPQAGPSGITKSSSQSSRGGSTVVGSCYLCRDEKKKQRKTRKVCTICVKPICNEHSTSIISTTCQVCHNVAK